MARVSQTAHGLDAVRARLGALPKLARRTAGQALRATAESAAADLRAALRTGPDPSAPGEAPSDPEGRIAAAVSVTAEDGGGATVTVDLPFARDLEFGTRTMAARPVLRPAAQRAGHDAKSRLAKAVAAALKGRTS